MVLKLRLVVDSNILFAALIRKGLTSRLILSERVELYAPERLFDEFEKYREYILSKTHRSEEDFERFLSILEGRIEIIPRCEFESWLKEAKRVCKLDDFPFVALAKALECAIWSNDRELKKFSEKTKYVEVLSTKEVLERLRVAL